MALRNILFKDSYARIESIIYNKQNRYLDFTLAVYERAPESPFGQPAQNLSYRIEGSNECLVVDYIIDKSESDKFKERVNPGQSVLIKDENGGTLMKVGEGKSWTPEIRGVPKDVYASVEKQFYIRNGRTFQKNNNPNNSKFWDDNYGPEAMENSPNIMTFLYRIVLSKPEAVNAVNA